MRKIIYLCGLALLAINLNCETEDIIVNEQNEIIQQNKIIENSETTGFNSLTKNTELDNVSKTKPINVPNNSVLEIPSNSLDFGGKDIGGLGLENDGDFFDGTNFMNAPPNGGHWTLLITYAPGVSEVVKRSFRVTYQQSGELWYFEQCPNDPQKELWSFVYAGSNVPCQVPPGNGGCQRGDVPPLNPPTGLATVAPLLINQNCDD